MGRHSNVKQPNLLYYLLMDTGRIIGMIPFPRDLAIYKMKFPATMAIIPRKLLGEI